MTTPIGGPITFKKAAVTAVILAAPTALLVLALERVYERAGKEAGK